MSCDKVTFGIKYNLSMSNSESVVLEHEHSKTQKSTWNIYESAATAISSFSSTNRHLKQLKAETCGTFVRFCWCSTGQQMKRWCMWLQRRDESLSRQSLPPIGRWRLQETSELGNLCRAQQTPSWKRPKIRRRLVSVFYEIFLQISDVEWTSTYFTQ